MGSTIHQLSLLQGQNLLKKKVMDAAHWQTKHTEIRCMLVGMLLTGIQSTETRDTAYWFTEHRNKLHVGCHHENQCDETIQQSLALHQ